MVDYFEELSPNHQMSPRSSVSQARNGQLNLWGRYVDGITARDGNNLLSSTKVDVGAYTQLYANLIWPPTPNPGGMLSGLNLLHSSQLEYLMEYVTPPTEIERVLFGKLTWRCEEVSLLDGLIDVDVQVEWAVSSRRGKVCSEDSVLVEKTFGTN